VKRDAKGSENLKSLDVSGVYVRDRYWVGGLAVAGIIDSKGTDKAGLRDTVDIAGSTLVALVLCPVLDDEVS
jgi:hypothetical protein